MVPCLRCNPTEDALRWCNECCEKQLREMDNLRNHTKHWKWFAYGIGEKKIAYWRAIFAPNMRAADTYMRQRYSKEPYRRYESHPDPSGSCVIAERIPIPDSAWRED